MRIPQTIIDQVLNQTDIVDIVSDIVTLKKTGANFKACCPFHQEKTASFVVSPTKQIFHCFGCGAGGNVVGFLMQSEKMTFPEAVEKLAARLNIKIARDDGPQKENPDEIYFKINAYAQWFFTENYQASKAFEYAQSRFLSVETQKLFELGYAPDSFEALVNFLTQKKVPLTQALHLGLIKAREGQKSHYDFYRDRLTFPIRNARGHIVGFGGRTLSHKDEAKYINSPESPVYHKSRELYGFHQARKNIIANQEALVVEGYIDVIACFQNGLTNTVAPLGTALTTEHVKILKRYATTLTLMFDGDDAGKKAALKALETCFGAGFHPKLIILPEEKDPGDYAHSQNPEELRQIVANAKPALDVLFALLTQKATNQPSQRAGIIKKLAFWVRLVPDALEKMEYRKWLARHFEMTQTEVQKIVEITYESTSLSRPPQKGQKGMSLEAQLILAYLRDTESLGPEGLQALYDDFENEELKNLAKIMSEKCKYHETSDARFAINDLPDALQGMLAELLIDDENSVVVDGHECLKKFRLKASKQKRKAITARIHSAEMAQDTVLTTQLLQEKQRLLAQDS